MRAPWPVAVHCQERDRRSLDRVAGEAQGPRPRSNADRDLRHSRCPFLTATMPLRTISLFTYRTKGGGWTAAQLGVLEFVHALKKQDLEGTARVLVKGGEATRRLAAQNASDAFDWFAEMVVPLLREELATTKVVLVPIPDCGCTEDGIESRTNALAIAVARQEGAVVVSDILRWRRRL